MKRLAVGVMIRRGLPSCLPHALRGVLPALWFLVAPVVAAETAAPSTGTTVLNAHARWSVDEARAGERIALIVVIRIADGFHINADAGQIAPHPSFRPYPTQVQILDLSPAVAVGAPQFPPAHTIEVGFSDQPLAVFDGRVDVTIPVEVPSDPAADAVKMRLALRYQGCDAKSCWMPETVTLNTQLPIDSPSNP